MITQSAAVDSDGVPHHRAEHRLFGARAREGRSAAHAGHAARASLQRLGRHQYAGLQVTAAQVNAQPAGAFGEFIGVLTAPLSRRARRIWCCASTPTARRRISARLRPSTTSRFFPPRSPTTPAWCAPASPTIRKVTTASAGCSPSPKTTARRVRAAFVLRGQLYFVKEHSIYSTQDDGVNEPAELDAQRSLADRGHAFGGRRGRRRGLGGDRRSLRAVPFRRRRAGENLAGDSAAVGHHQLGRMATRCGCAWIRAPSAFWSACRSRRPRSPTCILALDYRSLQPPSDHRLATLRCTSSSYRADVLPSAGARKWAPWHITANAATLAERPTAPRSFFSATAPATAKSTS